VVVVGRRKDHHSLASDRRPGIGGCRGRRDHENADSPGSSTSISGAINFAVQLFEENPYRGLRRVIDISGDGPNNDGAP